MSAKVSLRRFEAGDAAAVHRWFSNRELTENLLETRLSFSEEEAERWVERAMRTDGEDRKFAVVMEGHTEVVGFTALYGLFRQIAPELGALIGEPVAWGKGVGREAERLTLARAFGEFGAHRVYGRIPAINERAKRAFQQQGARPEGVMRRHIKRDGRFIDVEIWGVIAEEFTGRDRPPAP